MVFSHDDWGGGLPDCVVSWAAVAAVFQVLYGVSVPRCQCFASVWFLVCVCLRGCCVWFCISVCMCCGFCSLGAVRGLIAGESGRALHALGHVCSCLTLED